MSEKFSGPTFLQLETKEIDNFNDIERSIGVNLSFDPHQRQKFMEFSAMIDANVIWWLNQRSFGTK